MFLRQLKLELSNVRFDVFVLNLGTMQASLLSVNQEIWLYPRCDAYVLASFFFAVVLDTCLD